MAQRIIHTLVSDLPPHTEADPENGVHVETVPFGLGKDEFDIDLTADEAEKLREILAPYIANGRKTGGSRTRGKATTAATRQAVTNAAAANKAPTTPRAGGTRSREETAAIREWAKSHGYEVSERGRIPNHVEEAYENAHKGRKPGGVPTGTSTIADAPSADSADAQTDGEGTEELSGWQEPTRPLSAVPSLPEGDDPAAGTEPEEEKPNGLDKLTPTRREAIRAWAKAQGMEVKDKGVLKKDLITQAIAWENAHGSLDVAAAESRDAAEG